MKRIRASMVIALASMVAGASAVAEAPAAHDVAIDGFKFAPETIKVHRGDTVVFTNKDIVPHTVTDDRPGKSDSGAIQSGGRWTFTASEQGTVHYHCAFHPAMHGAIEVD